MPTTLRTVSVSLPVNSIDDLKPRMAKAKLHTQSAAIPLTAVVKEALIRHHGSLKAAAIMMQIDPGQLTRDLQTGDFKLKKLDGDLEAIVAIAHALYDAFGQLDSPAARVRRVLREIHERLAEVEQYVEQAS